MWTVNGVEYSFDELELVADIIAASAAPVNEVELLALLNKAGINNINEDRLSLYAAEIVSEGPERFVNVQKNIDDVNKAEGDAIDEAAVVKTVVDATNQIQLKAALEANFDRVNANWMPNYAAANVGSQGGMLALAGPANYFGAASGVDADGIQAAIDTANNTAIETADGAADTSVKQAAVTVLIQNWVEDDDPETPLVTPKADAIEASQIKAAAFRVAEATTENSLYNALVAYANITPDATLKVSELNVNLKANYKAILDGAAFKTTLVSAIQIGSDDIKGSIVQASDTAALTTAMADVTAKYVVLNGTDNTANRTALKTALQKVADVTSHKTGTAKFDMSKVYDALLVDYSAEFAVTTAISNSSTVADLQGKITTVNEAEAISVALDVVNDEDATLVEVRTALIDIVIAQGAGTGSTDDDFIDLSAQAQLEVAELVVDERPAAGYADLDAIILSTDGTGALATAMATHTVEIAKFNAIGDLAGATTTSTRTALNVYAHDEYMALSNADRIAVAVEINGLTKVVADVVTPLNFSNADAVKTLAEANTIIDAAIAAVK